MDALLDIRPICYALDTFLQSKMWESEAFCDKSDEKKERLYFATGYGLIQSVKALMSYEDSVSAHPISVASFQSILNLLL